MKSVRQSRGIEREGEWQVRHAGGDGNVISRLEIRQIPIEVYRADRQHQKRTNYMDLDLRRVPPDAVGEQVELGLLNGSDGVSDQILPGQTIAASQVRTAVNQAKQLLGHLRERSPSGVVRDAENQLGVVCFRDGSLNKTADVGIAL